MNIVFATLNKTSDALESHEINLSPFLQISLVKESFYLSCNQWIIHDLLISFHNDNIFQCVKTNMQGMVTLNHNKSKRNKILSKLNSFTFWIFNICKLLLLNVIHSTLQTIHLDICRCPYQFVFHHLKSQSPLQCK